MSRKKAAAWVEGSLRPDPLPYRIWGKAFIDSEAVRQMDQAMRLPVAAAGALMPDAHVGYGLPIGGVLATENAVIPYAVGVDIACRMRLSIFPVSPILLRQKEGLFRKALMEQTRFGAGARWRGSELADHAVLADPDWAATRLLQSLKDTAREQLGTSGSGNHFVEWGSLHFEADDPDLGVERGDYLALLSHSGSRGVGFRIANHYSQLARKLRVDLDPAVQHLAWFSMDSHEGQEYWLSMELAGRFAAACHEVIHQRAAKAAGLKAQASVENHHNFAWKMNLPSPKGFQDSERQVIVHRKGATPAERGTLGIIPGSMADSGYLVRGKGAEDSLFSASHGAGRLMSRRGALESITRTQRDRYLADRGVTLLGGGLDESPQAYKPIRDIIASQSDLVEIVAEFRPIMVRMANEPGDT